MAGGDDSAPFAAGVEPWRRSLGNVREVVRQELVARQLAAHLPDAALDVLDAGCGQGTQAIALARLGHRVLGVDVSPRLLDDARRAAAAEPDDVRARLRFERGDLLDLGPERGAAFDLVCCHGVLMYLPALREAIAALVAAARRPAGLVSVLTRNRASLAMRAGMCGDWEGALHAFDADRYTNRLGVENARADDPAEVRAALRDAGAETLAWYGVRLFSDHFDAGAPPPDVAQLVAAEQQAGARDPYRSVAALTHTIAQVATPSPAA